MEDLRVSNARLEAILELASDAIISVDESQRVILFNKAAELMFGTPQAGAIGQPLNRFIPARFRTEHDRHVREYAATGATTRTVHRPGAFNALHANGTEFPVEATISQVAPSVEGEGRTMTVILRDISERRAMESRLQQAQTMDAVGQLAGGVAHDFNNLLMIILGNLDLMEMVRGDGTVAVDFAAEVRGAAERGTVLARQLLTFSRRSAPQRRAIDLNSTLARDERLLRRTLGERCELAIHSQGPPCVVDADIGQLEQVLMNLAVNARDAMPDGGTLTIDVDTCTVDATTSTRWPTLAPGRYVRLEFADTGTGMSEETRQRIFEPFFTTKAPGQGTGLGLAAVYGIVTQSGGAIDVESGAGAGTRFTILLPSTDKGIDAPTARQSPRRARGSGVILLVEDERPLRATVRTILEKSGYTVLEARHGEDALLVWNDNKHQIALVLTDLRMPQMGGQELATVLHAERSGLPILFMSGYDDQSLPEHEAAEPGRLVLQKPFTAPELLDAIAGRLHAME